MMRKRGPSLMDSVDLTQLSSITGTPNGVTRWRHLNTLVKLCTEFDSWTELQNEISIGYIPDLYKGNPYHRELAEELGIDI